jgi:hypothetical protein
MLSGAKHLASLIRGNSAKGFKDASRNEVPHRVYPERTRNEILHFVQNDQAKGSERQDNRSFSGLILILAAAADFYDS